MKRARSEEGISTPCIAAPKRRRVSLPNAAARADAKAGILGWALAVSEAGAPQSMVEQTMADGRARMPRVPSPRRRESKASYRQRSVSPTKKPTEYRSIYLSEAGVFIDHCHDVPAAAAAALDEAVLDAGLQADIHRIADEYCGNCRQSAKDGAGESEWRADLMGAVMRKLARLPPWKDVLKSSAAEKPWRAELKPVRSTAAPLARPMPPPILLSHRSFSTLSTVSDLLGLDTRDLETASDTLSTTTTSTYLTAAESDSDPEALSTPKPDLSIGLAHAWFSTPHQRILARPALHSDPHQAKIGLHFPFLIFEAKSAGSLFGAQNQAAVGAACMLRILEGVGCDGVVWSVATEGAVHELWVHHRVEGKYHSTFVDVWRMTDARGARAFMGALGRILKWGAGTFAGRVLAGLDGLGGAEEAW
ncbi:hypothetical protein P153DRAFT_435840 [Dothidotthia symphoricarpi CBS 119687]|uniref:DUF7924 domain-containing protein n=1 Tax=Dothidotthia symphoricarpi CBS 119687 TaxID=1392245 RepID=A0A6A5ZV60_9PLEO|nr:uncharacterized protein P153DRAFT_435840 [Dothidotthia symphoricarpi CBS 119687]KAF2123602.1 hypothetical protein P153DRAFT_435840 [Dothidotthia symphoricarpi CBS 119687]